MPIGDYFSLVSKNRVSKFVISRLGVFDLHTHLRIKPLIKFISQIIRNNPNVQLTVLEIGCGNGVNAFEIAKLVKKQKYNIKMKYLGVDLNEESIQQANKIAKYFYETNIELAFSKAEAISYLNNNLNRIKKDDKFNLCLLIDVIEHINNPDILISELEKYLHQDAYIIVSVPTKLYPKIFGYKFHRKIGHLVEGYDIDDLNSLFKNFQCIHWEYNTGFPANIGCFLYYNAGSMFFGNKYLSFLKNIILIPFKYLDFVNNKKISCSLFAVYKKN